MASEIDSDDDIETVLRKLIEGFESGEIKSATLRVALKDGTVQDVQVGYTSEEEKAAAMARLLRLLNELH